MDAEMSKPSPEEILYYIFFILLSVAKGLGFYEGQKMFMLLVIPAFLCAVLKLLLTPYTGRQWVMLLILLILTAIVYYESRELGIWFVMFTILGMKHISTDKIFRLGLRVWTLCAVLLSIWSFFRIEHTIYRVSNRLGLGYIMRWSLGFTHPNILHITYFALCAFILYELRENYGFRQFALLMIGNVLVFFYSVSYTGFGIVTVLLIGELYVTFRPRFGMVEKTAANLILPFIILVSFVLPLLFYAPRYGEALQKLNMLVNTRIKVAGSFLNPECMSLFGVKMSYLAQFQSYLSIDSSYIWLFIHYGMIPFVLFMAAYIVLVADYGRKQKTRELVIIICFLGAGLTEQLLFNTSFKNVTLLFLGELFFRQKEGAEEYYLIPALHRRAEDTMEWVTLRMPGRVWFPDKLPSRLGEIWKSYRSQILAGIVAGALLGAVLCGICYAPPNGYIIPRRNADWLEKSSVYLESGQDPDYEGYRIMNYQDPETPMQIVEGNAVVLETARYYTGSILIGGLTGYMVGAGIILLYDKRRLKHRIDS